jgi:hypothetical protein
VPPKVGGAADALASALQAPTTFFFLIAYNKKIPKTNQQSQTDHGKITTKPLNARLKN